VRLKENYYLSAVLLDAPASIVDGFEDAVQRFCSGEVIQLMDGASVALVSSSKAPADGIGR
jgi:hypothetical protein